MPSKATLDNVAILNKPDPKTLYVLGFAASVTSLVIHDGKHDHFDSMPPNVKGKFTSSIGMRSKMGLDRNTTSKVIAIILHSYKSKGPNNYDVSDRKFRSGYGTATITLVPRDTTAQNVQNFFSSSTKKLTTQTGGGDDGDPTKHVAESGKPSEHNTNEVDHSSDHVQSGSVCGTKQIPAVDSVDGSDDVS